MIETDERAIPRMKNFFSELGELRILLLTTTLLSLLAIPFTDTDVRMEGWGLLPDVLVPVVSFIVVFLILLDMLMSRVFMIEADEAKRKKFNRIFLLELLMVVALVVFWTPYFIAVLS